MFFLYYTGFKQHIDAVVDTPFLPHTFLAAAHLSLFTPLHYWFLPLIFDEERPLSWFDLHPGWRFLRICKTLSKLGFIESAVKSDLSNYEQIQTAVAEELSWPSPSDYRGYALTLGKVSMRELGWFVARTLKALLDSKDAPWAYVFSASRYPAFGTKERQAMLKALKIVSDFNPTIIFRDGGNHYGWRAKLPSGLRDEFVSGLLGKEAHADHSTRKSQALGSFSILFYLLTKWMDYIIHEESCDVDRFLSQVFPQELAWEQHRPAFVSYLNAGLKLVTGIGLSDYTRARNGSAVIHGE